jgi:hypothetical protein
MGDVAWLDPGEQIRKQGRTMFYIDKVRAFSAHMTLTDRRLRVESHTHAALAPIFALIEFPLEDKVFLDTLISGCDLRIEKFWNANRLVIRLPSGQVRRVLVDATWCDLLKIC